MQPSMASGVNMKDSFNDRIERAATVLEVEGADKQALVNELFELRREVKRLESENGKMKSLLQRLVNNVDVKSLAFTWSLKDLSTECSKFLFKVGGV